MYKKPVASKKVFATLPAPLRGKGVFSPYILDYRIFNADN